MGSKTCNIFIHGRSHLDGISGPPFLLHNIDWIIKNGYRIDHLKESCTSLSVHSSRQQAFSLQSTCTLFKLKSNREVRLTDGVFVWLFWTRVIIECSPALYIPLWFWPQRYCCHSAMVQCHWKMSWRGECCYAFILDTLGSVLMSFALPASVHWQHIKASLKILAMLGWAWLHDLKPLFSGARGAGWWWKSQCVCVWERLQLPCPWLVFRLVFTSKMFKRLCALPVP